MVIVDLLVCTEQPREITLTQNAFALVAIVDCLLDPSRQIGLSFYDPFLVKELCGNTYFTGFEIVGK